MIRDCSVRRLAILSRGQRGWLFLRVLSVSNWIGKNVARLPLWRAAASHHARRLLSFGQSRAVAAASRIAAAIAAFIAVFVDHRHKLAAGEIGFVLVLAPTQAQAFFNYVLAFFQSYDLVAQIESDGERNSTHK